DSPGFNLHVSEGVASRGDARRDAVEGGLNLASVDGTTRFSVYLAHSRSGHVRVGDRDYEGNDRRRAAANLPPEQFIALYRQGNSIAVLSDTGDRLAFKPEFGGGQLTSDYTRLPLGFAGGPDALAAALTQHSGELDASVPEGDLHNDLGSNPQTDALLL